MDLLDNERGGAVEFDDRIRNAPESLNLMPLMSFLWFFDIKTVALRSFICAAINECNCPKLAESIVYSHRRPGPHSWIKNNQSHVNQTDADAGMPDEGGGRDKLSTRANATKDSKRDCDVMWDLSVTDLWTPLDWLVWFYGVSHSQIILMTTFVSSR